MYISVWFDTIVSCLLIKCCKYFVFCWSTSAVFTAMLIMSSMIPLTILSLDIDETVRNFCIEFSVALSSTLIHVLAPFQGTTCSQIYFRFSSYLLRKPHLFVILNVIGWFIVNIQSDLFWHRCLERQAFGTPRIYMLSPSESIKGSNYGEFLKDKNVLLMHDCIISVQVRSEFGKFAYTAICMRNVYTLIWYYTCVFTRFHSVKNANTQLIWSSSY